MNDGCWLGFDLLFEQDVTRGIHDAHVDGFQGHVEAGEVLHFFLSLGCPYRVPR